MLNAPHLKLEWQTYGATTRAARSDQKPIAFWICERINRNFSAPSGTVSKYSDRFVNKILSDIFGPFKRNTRNNTLIRNLHLARLSDWDLYRGSFILLDTN